MTKTRFLALITALALLLAIPTAVLAQNARPHVFVGTATLDGAAALEGTAITAWVDGTQVAATNIDGGTYVLLVESATGFPGKTVIFRVGAATADQTATWDQGGGDEINLTASSGGGGGGGPGEEGGVGPRGARGAAGATGATGSAGPAGPTGSDGSAGSSGSTGSAGPAGPAGPAGATGATGDDGGGMMGIIALIVAIVALLGAGGAYMMGRRA